MKMVLVFEHNNKSDYDLKVIWKYESEDEMSRERGEEMQHSTEIKFELQISESNDFEDFSFEF